MVRAAGGLDNIDKRLAVEFFAFDRGIGFIDIGFVVLAVVIAQCLGRDRGFERGVVEGQVDKLEGHGSSPVLPEGGWLKSGSPYINARAGLGLHRIVDFLGDIKAAPVDRCG